MAVVRCRQHTGHSYSKSQSYPSSLPRGSEGTRDHSIWLVPMEGTSAPIASPRRYFQLALNL